MNAWTSVDADSSSSDRRTRRSWRNWKKHLEMTSVACLSRHRSGVTTTPRTRTASLHQRRQSYRSKVSKSTNLVFSFDGISLWRRSPSFLSSLPSFVEWGPHISGPQFTNCSAVAVRKFSVRKFHVRRSASPNKEAHGIRQNNQNDWGKTY